MTAARTPLDPRATADRLASIRLQLCDIADELHAENMSYETARVDIATSALDEAKLSLMVLARGDDGQ